MNLFQIDTKNAIVSAGCHINDVMNVKYFVILSTLVSAGCHINDVMNSSFHT